jgi:hypothetical protein
MTKPKITFRVIQAASKNKKSDVVDISETVGDFPATLSGLRKAFHLANAADRRRVFAYSDGKPVIVRSTDRRNFVVETHDIDPIHHEMWGGKKTTMTEMFTGLLCTIRQQIEEDTIPEIESRTVR